MKNRIIIPGPPGTGKTYRLMQYIKKEVEEYKTHKIRYFTYLLVKPLKEKLEKE
jgi:DNA replication protein DnaC